MSTSSTNYKYGTGLRNAGSYKVSGHPYVTGSVVANGQEHAVKFPFVSKSVTVIASGSTAAPLIGVTFNSTGSDAGVMAGKHYITLTGSGDTVTFDTKCKEIYIHALNASSGFEIHASLTNINTSHMYDLTGSGLTD